MPGDSAGDMIEAVAPWIVRYSAADASERAKGCRRCGLIARVFLAAPPDAGSGPARGAPA